MVSKLQIIWKQAVLAGGRVGKLDATTSYTQQAIDHALELSTTSECLSVSDRGSGRRVLARS